MLMLPTCHSEAELELARRIGAELESAELHVFWTEQRAEPRRPAAPELPPGLVRGLALVGAVIEAVSSVIGPRRALGGR